MLLRNKIAIILSVIAFMSAMQETYVLNGKLDKLQEQVYQTQDNTYNYFVKLRDSITPSSFIGNKTHGRKR